MRRSVMVHINAANTTCGRCKWKDYGLFAYDSLPDCMLFGKELETRGARKTAQRCKQCLQAERNA